MTAEAPSPRQSDALRAILLMCLGVGMFPFLNTCVKLLTANYPVVEIVWARFAGHFLTMVVVFLPSRGWRLFQAHRPAIQIARSFLLLGSTAFFVSAIGLVPLATASAIGFSSPIIVTALMAIRNARRAYARYPGWGQVAAESWSGLAVWAGWSPHAG